MTGPDYLMLKTEMRMVRIVLGFVCGFICSRLAKKQNRNETWAFAAGMLFNVFALAYYLFMAARRSESGQADYVKCNECGEIFVNNVKRCPKCKKEATKNNVSRVK